MKKRLNVLWVLILFFVGSTSLAQKSSFQLRSFKEKELANGLKVFFIPDQTLPSFTLKLMIPSGSASDPKDRPGLGNFVAALLDKGTLEKNSTQIASALAELGAEFRGSVGDDSSFFEIRGLSFHIKELMALFEEIMFKPRFALDEIARYRKNALAGLANRIDDADSFADVVYQDYLYGAHPYAHSTLGTSASLRTIKKKHLITHYRRHYRPDSAILAVVGKFDESVEDQIVKVFSSWGKGAVKSVQWPQTESISDRKIRVYNNSALVQAQIRMGHFGIKRNHEDFLRVRVANTILGGAFHSRLNSRIRRDLGLTYSISSHFDPGEEVGSFTISTFTKNNTVGQTVTETLNLYGKFVEEGVTKEEVEQAKGYLKGIFPSTIESAESFAQNLMSLRRYGISEEYLSKYLDNIDAIGPNDVNTVVKKYFDPKNVKILVYGKSAEILPQLKPLAAVELKQATQFK